MADYEIKLVRLGLERLGDSDSRFTDWNTGEPISYPVKQVTGPRLIPVIFPSRGIEDEQQGIILARPDDRTDAYMIDDDAVTDHKGRFKAITYYKIIKNAK